VDEPIVSGVSEQKRTELIELVRTLIEGTVGDEDEHRWLDRLEAAVPDPRVSDYIYWDRSDPPLTAEQIVDKALSYRPIAFGGSE
jgi:hypothetical protein